MKRWTLLVNRQEFEKKVMTGNFKVLMQHSPIKIKKNWKNTNENTRLRNLVYIGNGVHSE
jgi:hypothetical protein